MNARTDYLLQILDKIGGPLVAALARTARAVGTASDAAAVAQEDAQAIAQLLGRSVQVSIEIGRMMELEMSDPEAADRLRLALMVLAGPLIAGQYEHDGRVPGDAEIRKIMTGLESVLAFSQNFAPTEANAQSLSGAVTGVPDEGLESVRALQCFVPVINAVSAFPFGLAEKKLIQDVSSRITARADELAAALNPSGSSAADRQVLLRALADIYAECHAEEMRLMLARPAEEADNQKGLDSVWARFDTRAAMLEILASNLVPGASPSARGDERSPAAAGQPPVFVAAPSAVTPPPDSPPPAPVVPAVFSSAPQTPPAEAPVAPPALPVQEAPPSEPAPPAAPPSGFNPMSMFSKKEETGDAPAGFSPPPAAEPLPPAEPSAPPPEASVTPPPLPAAEPPPAPPQGTPAPAEDKDQDSGDGSGGDGSGNGGAPANPMSFFKKSE